MVILGRSKPRYSTADQLRSAAASEREPVELAPSVAAASVAVLMPGQEQEQELGLGQVQQIGAVVQPAE